MIDVSNERAGKSNEREEGDDETGVLVRPSGKKRNGKEAEISRKKERKSEDRVVNKAGTKAKRGKDGRNRD